MMTSSSRIALDDVFMGVSNLVGNIYTTFIHSFLNNEIFFICINLAINICRSLLIHIVEILVMYSRSRSFRKFIISWSTHFIIVELQLWLLKASDLMLIWQETSHGWVIVIYWRAIEKILIIIVKHIHLLAHLNIFMHHPILICILYNRYLMIFSLLLLWFSDLMLLKSITSCCGILAHKLFKMT